MTGIRRPRISIGLAGWANPSDAKAARAAGQTHLEYYAAQFSCVEINSTFYRSHRRNTYARWRDATPREFRFSVKMPRTITHDSGLKGVRRNVRGFLDEIEALGEKLRAVLIQLPPSQRFSPKLARDFLKALPRQAPVHFVCEPRHASWFSAQADALLAQFGIARVGVDPPRVTAANLPGGAPDFAYFRWHGSPRPYYSSYSDLQLESFARSMPRGLGEIWCIFDNTATGAAWPNAQSFKKAVKA